MNKFSCVRQENAEENQKQTIIYLWTLTRSLTTAYRQPKQSGTDHRLKSLQKHR